MTSPEKNSCLKGGESMESDTTTASGDSNEADEVENFSNFTGVKLIYFEHSYIKNYAALCEIYENSKSETEKVQTHECVENQVPVRRSQRQINKSDNVSVNVVDTPSTVQSPTKSKMCIEEKSKENIDLSKSNISVSNSTITSPIRNKSPKNENKLVGDISVNNTKIHPKNELVQQLSPSKVLKKVKMSEPKVILEKTDELELRRKISGKEENLSSKEVELKKKEIADAIHTESRRKRAFSEPSKNDTFSPAQDNVDKEMIKSKKVRGLAKQKSPLKTKKVEKANTESSGLKKRKRNMSAPAEKMEIVNEKLPDTNKGKRKASVLTQDSISKEPVKIENKKNLYVENKGPLPKGISPSNTTVKPKFKKSSRRESLRLVINEDEPPLFSQPDVMVKVKSDDSVKKEDKIECDIKNQPPNSNTSEHSSKSTQLLENISNVEFEDSKTLEITNKQIETSSEVESTIENLARTTKEEFEDLQGKDDFKDMDSENSLHIDESIGKIFESENEENVKNEQSENTSNSTLVVPKGDAAKNDEKNVPSELVNANLSQPTKENVEDPDADKPIAERKPRRIIKKKEFFEDIATRTSTQTRKSAGKQKTNSDKKSSDEDSKQGKRRPTCKSEVDSEESSEDDPLKLWCICRQPHNDRFMIQCDKCEDWFHGSCVGVSRQQGRKLEKQQKEWICPNCLPKVVGKVKTEDSSEKKPEPEGRTLKVEKEENDEKIKHQINSLSRREKSVDKVNKAQTKSNQDKQIPPSPSTTSHIKSDVVMSSNVLNKKNFNKTSRNVSKGNEPPSNIKKGLREPVRKKQSCVSCQVVASVNSCYCSDKCLEKHAADCLAIMQEGKGILKDSDFDSQRIVVLDRVKGNVLAGDNAPTAGNIVSWLKANPSFMIACSSSSSPSPKHLVPKKEGDSSAATKDKKETSDESSKTTVRWNVRKTLKNILMDRCKNADDIQLPEDDIRKIAVKIEEELNALFKDNSFKYRAKYRSLMFNIKDPRNQGLFRKILKGNIPPDKLVRMSPEELASVELAKWREQENQHLLDMIKRVQLEQQSGSGLLLKKTHKGEVEIEDDFSVIDDIPKTTTTPTKLFSGEPAEVEKPEPDKEVVKDTTFHHRSHLFDLNCKICTGKIIPPPTEDSTPKKMRVAHSISVDLSSPAALDPVEKTVSRIVDGKSPLSSTGDDSMDQEPTSTVSIGSPDISLRYASDSESSGKVTSSVWKGFIYMQDFPKFVTSAYKVSGQTEYLHMDVPDTIQVCGRIIPDQVWDYLGKIKQSGNKELIIIRFQAANQEETVTYNSFYSYLSSRKRYGVVSNYSKKIKDFYILPLAATSPVPIVLMPFDGPGLPSPRPHLLLGVIVRHKSKQAGPPVTKKEKCKEDTDKLDGSYTPPLDTRSYTPPLPTIQSDNAVINTSDAVYSPAIDLKSSVPSEESDITQNSVESPIDVKNKESEIYEPSYTPPLQILPPESPKEDEEDKPYDPEQDILNIGTDKKEAISSPKENIEKGAENLEKHKKILDALTRQVEETDLQVNALKQLLSHPDDSDAEYHSPSTQALDINSVTATGMSSFLEFPENLQDILNVVREKSLDKEKLSTSKGDVDMRINTLFSKSFNKPAFESNKANNPQEKNSSRGATPPPEDNEENSPAVVRPSDPRIKIRTSFQESSFPSEEPANVSLSNMSVTELVERAEKELAEIEAFDKGQTSTQNVPVKQEKVDIEKIPSSWNQYKEPPPPGIEPSDLPIEDNTFSSKTVSSTSDNALPSSYSSPLIQDAQQVGPHFPPPFPPPLPPGFSIQTPPPNLKSFPPPNVISTSFPPPPLPIVTKASEVNPVSETWPPWNIPPQQSKDNNWQNRVPQWDDNWKSTSETASVDCSESSSHYFPPGTHDFNKDQFYRGETSSEGRWNRPQRYGRNNWHKRPARGGRWRGKRSFHFNKNQRN